MKTNTSTAARQQLLTLLAKLSFKLGDFQLSSGARSDYYIDCRTTTLHAEGARLTGLAILDLLAQHHLDPHAVGGLTLGADPLVSAVSIASAQRHLEQGRGGTTPARLVHGFLVRKAEKQHGTGRRIEGFVEAQAPVLIVDDVCTTGGSTIMAIEAARAAEMRVVGVVCLVERTEAHGRPAVEAAANGAPFLSLFTADDVRAEHVKHMPM
jgi:orotate phosphoribosyltransferase